VHAEHHRSADGFPTKTLPGSILLAAAGMSAVVVLLTAIFAAVLLRHVRIGSESGSV
jgi:hypothetical protein